MRWCGEVFGLVAGVGLVAVAAWGNHGTGEVVRAPPDAPAPQQAHDLAGRVAEIEKRLERMEQILFNTVQLEVFEAERRLDQATEQMRESEQLFLQGFLRESQVLQDRYEVDRARRELDLVRAGAEGRQIACEIELLQAQRDLEVAEQNLAHSEALWRRGFTTEDHLERRQLDVEQARKALALAKQRLENVPRGANTESAVPQRPESQKKEKEEAADKQPK